MKLACIGYREWALNIYKKVVDALPQHEFLLQDSKAKYSEDEIYKFKPDYVLFYGWSDMIKPELLRSFDCLMLHPSALPRYRGGSPIQNQIIDGVVESAVTIFLMDEGMDSGPISRQHAISLDGKLSEIFSRIESVGVNLTIDILTNGLNPVAQDHSLASYCKRRTPAMSEITLKELCESPANYLYNKIRMLQDPYPNAYFITSDGKKLRLTDCEID